MKTSTLVLHEVATRGEVFALPRAHAQAASAIAAWTAILSQLLLIGLIFLRPDLDPTWHTISEWVIGPYGWLMRLAFFLWAVSYTALFAALWPRMDDAAGKIGLVLLFICLIGAYGVGIFTTDPLDGSRVTTTGILHTIFGTTGLMLLPLAALLINRSLRKHAASSIVRRILRWTASLPLSGWAGFVIYTALCVAPRGRHAFGPGVNIGIPPRIAILTYALWTVIVARETRHPLREPSRSKTQPTLVKVT